MTVEMPMNHDPAQKYRPLAGGLSHLHGPHVELRLGFLAKRASRVFYL